MVPFAMEVFNMLKKEGKINSFIIDNMMNWQHSGFNIYCGQAVSPLDDEGVERLSQYIVRAPLSQERMTYIPEHESPNGTAKVFYQGKTTRANQTFTALDWLARLITHIPNKGEQTVRYYGYYSNKSRGMRKKKNTDDNVPVPVITDIKRKKFRKNWARLIQKIYNVDPLLCSKCSGTMRIISFIEDEATIKKILVHLNLWMPQNDKGLSPEHFKIIATKNHDPPHEDNCTIHIQPNRSYEWWESINETQKNILSQENYAEDIYQAPYEDEFSQLTPYEDI